MQQCGILDSHRKTKQIKKITRKKREKLIDFVNRLFLASLRWLVSGDAASSCYINESYTESHRPPPPTGN